MIRCNKGYTVNGKIVCKENYVGKNGITESYYAILMHLEHEYCNMCCSYCLCHPKPSNENLIDFYKADYKKMIDLIKETDRKRGICENVVHHFEIWGGEPLFNFEALSEVVKVLRSEWPDCMLSLSTNGLLLKEDYICDFLIKNRFKIQLSHDGLGQHLRGKDPLEDEVTLENCRALILSGVLHTINTTLSSVNYSWEDNIDYWWSKFDCSNLFIKLNKPYDSDYDFDFAFTDEKIIRRYLSEFISLYYRCIANKEDKLKPFRRYIIGQANRWGEGDALSTCRKYQAFAHNIDGPKQDWNFVITTEGKYSECELYEKVDNPGGLQPEYCNDCKYKNQMECKHCGAMKYPSKCIYGKAWMETLEIINRGKSNGCKCNG